MKDGGPPLIRHALATLLGLGGIFLAAPWPSVQGVLHTFLVLGLAPQSGNLLLACLWSTAAGWLLEGTLRIYPVLGGTAWANMTLTIAAAFLAKRWPAERLWVKWGQLALLAALHGLTVHAAVRMASGPHPWGSGWIWGLATVPLWGTLVHKFQARPYGR